jgi:putative transposase
VALRTHTDSRDEGSAYDNATAESFVDTFKTELVADRSWCTRSQLELAVLEYVSWFNHERLHESLGDVPPVEFENTYTFDRESKLSNIS